MTTKISKPEAVGTVWVAQASLYKGGKLVATCLDTPNAIAYGMKRTGATLSKGEFGDLRTAAEMTNRIRHSIDAMNDQKANLKRL